MIHGMPRLWVAAAMITFGAGCGRSVVTHTYAGFPYEERWIHPEAFAAYGAGRRAEASGKLDEARVLYARAADLDDGPEPRVRLGAVQCRRGDVAAADRAFADAERLAPAAGALWVARTECALHRGDAKAALAASERLLRTSDDPVGAIPLRVKALALAKRPDEAQAVARELAARFPRTQAGTEAAKTVPVPAPRDLYAALGDARRRGLSKGDLAVELAAAGHCQRIQEDARVWFDAEPTDPNLWSAALYCAFERADDEAVREVAARAPSRAPSDLAGLLLLRVIVVTAGPEQARALAGRFALDAPSKDAIQEAFRVALKRDVDPPR